MAQELQKAVSEVVFTPVDMTNSQTNAYDIDMRGYNAAAIIINFDAELNTNAVSPTVRIKSADATAATNATGSGTTVTANVTPDLTVAKQYVYHVDSRNLATLGHRYLRVEVSTATATNDDITVAATVLKYRAAEQPGSTTDMVASTNDVAVVV